MASDQFLNLRKRKIIQYSLFVCILIIQVFIAAFIISEIKNRKDISFFESQLKDVDHLDQFTKQSKIKFYDVQHNFQKYLTTRAAEDKEAYYESVRNLTKSFDTLNYLSNNNKNLRNAISSKEREFPKSEKLRTIIDSVTQKIPNPTSSKVEKVPSVTKYKYDYVAPEVNVETENYTDTIQKKKLFGRLKDAISGKENVRKDSTVVKMKEIVAESALKSQKIVDSLMSAAERHYTKQINNVQVVLNKNELAKSNHDVDELQVFERILNYNNDLMGFYDTNIKLAKSNLENELENQRAKNDKRRLNFIIAALVLMFIVSILIFYFTRVAFFYEEKLRAADQLNKENLKFKNRILGMLSHELRSPLKIIGIFANRIIKKTTDEGIKENLKSISFTSNSLLMQANQILEYTKNQEVENKLVKENFNLKDEVSSILNSIEPYIETRNNQFSISETIDPSLVVYTDRTKLNQLFMNIIGNANKFTENGKISVISKVIPLDSKSISLETEVVDTGAGISETDLKSIFEPYYQGVLSNDLENLGAGLGLSLCKEIVALYDGTISATSQIGKGTRVKFALQMDLKN